MTHCRKKIIKLGFKRFTVLIFKFFYSIQFKIFPFHEKHYGFVGYSSGQTAHTKPRKIFWFEKGVYSTKYVSIIRISYILKTIKIMNNIAISSYFSGFVWVFFFSYYLCRTTGLVSSLLLPELHHSALLPLRSSIFCYLDSYNRGSYPVLSVRWTLASLIWIQLSFPTTLISATVQSFPSS